MRNLLRAFCGLCMALIAGQTCAQAAVSEWVTVHGGAVRLISAGLQENGSYSAGIEFSLEPGWHTYWRFPGESGIPPMIDFSASRNLGSADVLYPAPSRYNDGFSNSIVYHDAVVLPVAVTPEGTASPVELSLSLQFGVCKDICVPGEAELSLTLSPDGKPDKLAAMLIDRDLDLVPAPAGDTGPRILSIEDQTTDKGHRLLITAEVSPDAEIDLLAEGPEGSYIALPVLKERSGASATWSLSTNGLARQGSGSLLTVLIKDGERTVEQTLQIDEALLPPPAN